MQNTMLSNSITELKQISNDVERHSSISNLYYRVDILFFNKIKIINEHLSTLKTALDINWKFRDTPPEITKLINNLISLIGSTGNLNDKVISKDNLSINECNELIIETLADMDNIPENTFTQLK